ncbi:MAG: hypothetical protein ACK559_28235, partial [bacterium]
MRSKCDAKVADDDEHQPREGCCTDKPALCEQFKRHIVNPWHAAWRRFPANGPLRKTRLLVDLIENSWSRTEERTIYD